HLTKAEPPVVRIQVADGFRISPHTHPPDTGTGHGHLGHIELRNGRQIRRVETTCAASGDLWNLASWDKALWICQRRNDLATSRHRSMVYPICKSRRRPTKPEKMTDGTKSRSLSRRRCRCKRPTCAPEEARLQYQPGHGRLPVFWSTRNGSPAGQ